ncbi:MAG: hypothetical protein JO110_00915, partial [Acetobacteraceae bacterium]|nr:hypothetical protein [Acetobacteraceae bacterium]
LERAVTAVTILPALERVVTAVAILPALERSIPAVAILPALERVVTAVAILSALERSIPAILLGPAVGWPIAAKRLAGPWLALGAVGSILPLRPVTALISVAERPSAAGPAGIWWFHPAHIDPIRCEGNCSGPSRSLTMPGQPAYLRAIRGRGARVAKGDGL